ncbi:A-kinase anchor protein 14-like [Pocillopora damicornis]|uniref:A-kinase anchor protein 14-like n=1 Tax=Pocillopora damicornis TaxID=46731 RepID=UPI000F550852|nr:A-kinase anchor protein 14-like [Pocillopora damicornis]
MSSAGTTKKVPSVIRTVVPGNRTLDQIYEDEAREIVDEAIENARRRMADYAGEDGREGEAPAQQDQPIIDPETGYEIPNIKWMTADNFTVAGGLEKIEEFIKTWERDGSWLYCIDFLREEEYPYSWRYRYAVKWSIPTRRRPIPRATASVYITIEVSKFKPKTFPVEVYYIFETHHLVHRPGRTRFREKWLKDIIESKIQLMGAVEF